MVAVSLSRIYASALVAVILLKCQSQALWRVMGSRLRRIALYIVGWGLGVIMVG